MKAILPLLVAALAAGLVHAEEVPAAAAKLKEIREREINKINVAYLQKLDTLLVDYRAKGDSEAVAAVEALIAEIEKGKPVPAKESASAGEADMAAIIGKWRRDYDRNIIEFKDAKNGVYAGTTPFTISYNPENRMLTLTAEKWVDTVSFTLHRDVLKGGHNNKVPYKLERIK